MYRIMIAGTHSGCGKTTVTCAVLAALKKRGLNISSFKCGPDYIDPMFHRRAVGIPSYNLDPFFSDSHQLRQRIAGSGFAVLEGAMGYYDGAGIDGDLSSYEVAKATETPVILVIDARGMYASAGAVLKGFRDLKTDSNIKGVIFNNVSPSLYKGLSTIAKKADIIPLGFLPNEAKITFQSRHLGLITAAEITDIEEKILLLAEFAEKYIDLDKVIDIANDSPEIKKENKIIPFIGKVSIAVSKDEAFCFMYDENLEMLKNLGCKIEFFSPIHDKKLPEGISGIYLCGGYPELYLSELSGNTSMINEINSAIKNGVPTISECGGFLYLHSKIDSVPMAGIINSEAYKTNNLKRFGYVNLTAKRDNLLCKSGECIRAHEFHYYESGDCGADFEAEKPITGKNWDCVHSSETIYAGFPHLYFESNPEFAENFVRKAISYETEKLNGTN